MNELCLFAGIGGGSLGTKLLGFRTVCYVENERYCIDVLKARIADGFLDEAPIWDDVKSFDGRPWSGLVDVLTAGPPCQPFSRAGQHRAESDSRNLWPETLRIVSEVRPLYCLLENVPNLISCGYFGTIIGELSEIGYDCRWEVISASAVGAPHLRKRVWTVGKNVATIQADTSYSNPNSIGSYNTEADQTGQRGKIQPRNQQGGLVGSLVSNVPRQRSDIGSSSMESSWWKTEPDVERVVDGDASTVDRLKAIGNAQVASVVVKAWRLLTGE